MGLCILRTVACRSGSPAAVQPRSPRPSKNPGRLRDALLRVAIEVHAVQRAMDHYGTIRTSGGLPALAAMAARG
jgi:hypothetical protein